VRETVSLGRIAGVKVGINWSALAIVVVIVAGLATGQLPGEYPGRSPVAYVIAAVIAAVLFLASLLAHELAHAIVARRNGVQVHSIVLWLLGGVAQLEGQPQTPGADFRIAVVGPVTSFVWGLVFGAVGWVAAALDADRLAVGVLVYLAGTNILLAVFNLIPAAPLDGGRVLRAALWRRRGDRESAAITAARAGRVVGFALAGIGLLESLMTGTLNGIWLALVGWFLVSAATAEEQQARIGSRLSSLRVSDVMTSRPVVADATMTLADFHRPAGAGPPVLRLPPGRPGRPADRAGDAQPGPGRPAEPASRHPPAGHRLPARRRADDPPGRAAGHSAASDARLLRRQGSRAGRVRPCDRHRLLHRCQPRPAARRPSVVPRLSATPRSRPHHDQAMTRAITIPRRGNSRRVRGRQSRPRADHGTTGSLSAAARADTQLDRHGELPEFGQRGDRLRSPGRRRDSSAAGFGGCLPAHTAQFAAS
jgi:Zn-dependent protease